VHGVPRSRSSLSQPIRTPTPELHLAIGSEATGSPVPCQRLRRAHATYTPDIAKAARRQPLDPRMHIASRLPAIPTIAGFDAIVLHFDASAVVHTCSSSRRVPDPLTAGLLRSRFPPGLSLSGRYVLPGRSTGFDHCPRDLGLDTKPDSEPTQSPGCKRAAAVRQRATRAGGAVPGSRRETAAAAGTATQSQQATQTCGCGSGATADK